MWHYTHPHAWAQQVSIEIKDIPSQGEDSAFHPQATSGHIRYTHDHSYVNPLRTSWALTASSSLPAMHSSIMLTLHDLDTPKDSTWCTNVASVSYSPGLHWGITITTQRKLRLCFYCMILIIGRIPKEGSFSRFPTIYVIIMTLVVGEPSSLWSKENLSTWKPLMDAVREQDNFERRPSSIKSTK